MSSSCSTLRRSPSASRDGSRPTNAPTCFPRSRPSLRSILKDSERPVQIIFAGKAHPADKPGQELIRRIFDISRNSDLRGHIVFVENYNMRVARMLVQGVDVWLNNPRRPHEASGTSGMKAPVNGGINFSVADGWWC